MGNLNSPREISIEKDESKNGGNNEKDISEGSSKNQTNFIKPTNLASNFEV